jgi:hypothetical protein
MKSQRLWTSSYFVQVPKGWTQRVDIDRRSFTKAAGVWDIQHGQGNKEQGKRYEGGHEIVGLRTEIQD